MDWNYDMDACPLDTKVRLLSESDFPLLPQAEYVGTITHNGRFRTRGKYYEGDPDCFYRSAIVAWKPYEEKKGETTMTHTVTIATQVQLEEYFVLRGIIEVGEKKKVISEKEFDAEPTLTDIAQFLMESGADFVSKVVNYRVSGEMPFV